jgi:hypothetical protein
MEDETGFVSVRSGGEAVIGSEFYLGQLNDTKIFNLFDTSRSKHLIILSSDYLVRADRRLEEGLDNFFRQDDFGYKFTDFRDEAALNSFMEQPPEWLRSAGSDINQQREFLRKKVWIQIITGVAFYVTTAKDALFFQVD